MAYTRVRNLQEPDPQYADVLPGPGLYDPYAIGPPEPGANMADLAGFDMPPAYQPEQFKGNRWLEALAGLQPLPYAPRGAAQGFLSGLTSSLGAEGQKRVEARQKFESGQETLRATNDAERRQISREYRQSRQAKDTENRKNQTIDQRRQADYERDNPLVTDAMVKANPSLAPNLGNRVPAATAYAKPDFLAGMGPKERIKYEADLAGAKAASVRKNAPPITKAAASKPATGQERQSMAFYVRARDAADTVKGINVSQVNPTKIYLAIDHPLASSLLNDQEQVYLQAIRQFTEARLRKESGSAINKDEYKKDFQANFPQPGDKKAAIQRKEQAREIVLGGLKFTAGKAYDEFYSGTQPEAQSQEFDYDPNTDTIVPR